jgi:hypothetical protein
MAQRKSRKEHYEERAKVAMVYIDSAIENTDAFGRTALFHWPNGRELVSTEEHKEVMKALLYWKREIEVFKELVIDTIDTGDQRDDTTG